MPSPPTFFELFDELRDGSGVVLARGQLDRVAEHALQLAARALGEVRGDAILAAREREEEARSLGRPPAAQRVGDGTGHTRAFEAGAEPRDRVVVHDEVERIVVCEIEPLVPQAAAEWLGPQNYYVVDDPRTELIFDDARHFIATTDEKFDVITSDPIHPWVSGSAALYSAEYYELVKQRLNPEGIVAQWLPLYETSEEAVKSSLVTFMEAFPNGTVWNSDIFGEGYDVVMIGSVEPMSVDVMAIDPRVEIWIVECKSSRTDFTSDSKWSMYLEWCDAFYWAVDADFPSEILPLETGVIVADDYDAEIVRTPERSKLPGARRRSLTLKFAHAAAGRHIRQTDPGLAL